MIRTRRRAAAFPLLAGASLAMALTGCGGTEPEPSVSGSGSAKPSSTATATATPSGSATPTPSPDSDPAPAPPAAPPTGTALTARGAYNRCVEMVSMYLYESDTVVPGPFAAADVIARTDGKWYVYTDVSVTTAPTPQQRDVAYECVLGGTVETPIDDMFGAVVRSPLSQRDPNMSVVGED